MFFPLNLKNSIRMKSFKEEKKTLLNTLLNKCDKIYKSHCQEEQLMDTNCTCTEQLIIKGGCR